MNGVAVENIARLFSFWCVFSLIDYLNEFFRAVCSHGDASVLSADGNRHCRQAIDEAQK